MAETWECFCTNIEGNPATILVNVGLRDEAPDPLRPWLLGVWVPFQTSTPDGFFDAGEADTLFAIEDALVPAAEALDRVAFLGRVTARGRREFYFHGPSVEGFSAAVEQAMSPFPAYAFQQVSEEDSAWGFYLGILYPTPQDFQCIANQHLLEALKKQGDSIHNPRLVSHWANFPSLHAQRAFLEGARRLGFAAQEIKPRDHGRRDLPFGARADRVDSIDLPTIDAVTLELYHLVSELRGKYDGWECPVVTDP